MAPFLLLLILLSEAASDVIERTVHPGDDVTMSCQAADSSISVVEWTRADLKPATILLYRDGHLNPTYQNPSFKDRVELVDRDLKDGDVSLTLKKVTSVDNGTYECRVASADSRLKKRAIIDSEPISTTRLQVTEPAGNSSPVGLYGGLAAAVLLLVTVAVGDVLIY